MNGLGNVDPVSVLLVFYALEIGIEISKPWRLDHEGLGVQICFGSNWCEKWASHGHMGEGTWSLKTFASDSGLMLHSFLYLSLEQTKNSSWVSAVYGVGIRPGIANYRPAVSS